MAAITAAIPIALGLGAGAELQATAGYRRRRRPHRLAGPDPLHHAGHLLVPRLPDGSLPRGNFDCPARDWGITSRSPFEALPTAVPLTDTIEDASGNQRR